MKYCPKCGSESDMKDSRPREGNVLARRRHCVKCGERWGTIEVSLSRFRRLERLEASFGSIRQQINEACNLIEAES